MKKCSKCHQTLEKNKFYKCKTAKDGYAYACKKCNNSYMVFNRAKKNEYWRKFRRKRRGEIIDKYGGQCVCCGEKEFKFLTFDHISGGGNKHKAVVGRSNKFYSWIIKNNYPKILQILCYNCNQAKSAWGLCPHKNNETKMEKI